MLSLKFKSGGIIKSFQIALDTDGAGFIGPRCAGPNKLMVCLFSEDSDNCRGVSLASHALMSLSYYERNLLSTQVFLSSFSV